MSKIIKYSNITLDKDNKFNIDVPSYEDINSHNSDDEHFDEDEGFYDDGEFDGDEEFLEDDGLDGDSLEEDGTPKKRRRKFRIDNVFSKSPEEIAQDILNDANSKAEEIILEAKKEADSIIYDTEETAFKRAEEIKEKAKTEGYDEGYKKAMDEIQSLKEDAEATLLAARAESERMIHEVEPQVIELTYSIIAKILNDSKFINKDIIKCIVKNGLSHTKITGDVYVHVSEEDYEVALKNKDDIYSVAEGNTTVEIIRDSELAAGDCLIETPFGNIQCGIDQQLKALKKSLFYILENG